MELDTLKHIEKNETVKAINVDLTNNNKEFIAIPEGVKLESLERFSPNRFRFRGNFKTNSFTDFVKMILANPVGACFVDAENLEANHIFNFGDFINAGHCDNNAVLTLRSGAAYSAVKVANSQKMTQIDFSQWFEEWRDFIEPFDEGGGALPFAGSLLAIKNIDIKQTKNSSSNVSNMGYELSAIEKIQAESAYKIPASFMFTCKPYESINQRSFKCKIGVITSDKPTLFFRIEQIEIHREEIAREFCEKIQAATESKITVLAGSFQKLP